jgi:hypothetical protein
LSSILASILSWKESILANIHSIICSIVVVRRCNTQDPIQFPIQSLLTPVVTC